MGHFDHKQADQLAAAYTVTKHLFKNIIFSININLISIKF